MILSLLLAIAYFIISIYYKGTNDTTVSYIFFILGLLNLAVWMTEYIVDRIKKHIHEKFTK